MTSNYSQLSIDPLSSNQIAVTITYLEQTERPALVMPPAPSIGQRRNVALMRVEQPPVHFYRYMYDLVGAPFNWISRRTMSDDDLAAILHDENVYFYVLYVGGAPAGLAEIDARNETTHEIKFFGLAPDFTGLGLGRYFFTNVLDLAWSRAPQCLKLETCTLDHPAALPLYQKFGFKVTGRRQGFVQRLIPNQQK
ncbi:GNAT family N-acetyltransferase [Hyphococcus formosus]|uniref:GNAT family N-acetyltransferase n=1 Tax=Hyphococcus formosus TaxID=3143534 RepID=UPI00398A98AC